VIKAPSSYASVSPHISITLLLGAAQTTSDRTAARMDRLALTSWGKRGSEDTGADDLPASKTDLAGSAKKASVSYGSVSEDSSNTRALFDGGGCAVHWGVSAAALVAPTEAITRPGHSSAGLSAEETAGSAHLEEEVVESVLWGSAKKTLSS